MDQSLGNILPAVPEIFKADKNKLEDLFDLFTS